MRTVRLSASWAKLFAVIVLLSLPRACFAYVTWGDFHVFAVIFFSFLGGFLGLGAIFGAIYFACGKNFLDRHQQQVVQTHRKHHPWPPGSARWHLQQMSWLFERKILLSTKKPDFLLLIKSERPAGNSVSGGGQTSFPVQKSSSQYGQSSRSAYGLGYPVPNSAAAYYSDVLGGVAPASFYQRALDYCGAGRAPDRQPIIGVAQTPANYYAQQAASYAASLERPTYFTPTAEKHLVPVQENFEEYRVMREESFVSFDGGKNVSKSSAVAEERNENTAQQQHQQHSQQSQLVQKTTTTTRASRRCSPQTRTSNTYI